MEVRGEGVRMTAVTTEGTAEGGAPGAPGRGTSENREEEERFRGRFWSPEPNYVTQFS